jgi:hypothetical protein
VEAKREKYSNTELKLNTPVALFFYNRPDLLNQVIDQINRLAIPKLFLFSDGFNYQKQDDSIKVEQCRKLCEDISCADQVIKIYRDSNVGLYRNITEGIDHVFSETDACIFLEDDTLPDVSFFSFCQEMLDHFKNDERILLVQGANLINSGNAVGVGGSSFFFTEYAGIWGWASWRHKWNKFYDADIDPKFDLWKTKSYKGSFRSNSELNYWAKKWELLKTQKSTWDAQVTFAIKRYGLLSIVPAKNLVKNIGFGDESATHTISYSKRYDISVEALTFPLKYPTVISRNSVYDKKMSLAKVPHLSRRILDGIIYRVKILRTMFKYGKD